MNAMVGRPPRLSPADLRKCGNDIARRELQDARLAAGLNEAEAARVLGVSVDTIERQECGESRVDAGLVFALHEFAAQQRTGT